MRETHSHAQTQHIRHRSVGACVRSFEGGFKENERKDLTENIAPSHFGEM